MFEAAYGRLWVLASALVGDRSEAEDLVQESAIVGLQKFSTFEPGSNFCGWMARIVRYQARNWLSKSARRRTTPTAPDRLDAQRHAQDPRHAPPVREARDGDLGTLREGFDDEVVDALDAVAATPRACLLLKVVHDLTYAEIGAMLGIPEGTAMSHVHRTRMRVRKQLEGRSAAERR